MGKIKVSGHQIAKLQKQAEELKNEIINDKAEVIKKDEELKVLNEAIASLQKLNQD